MRGLVVAFQAAAVGPSCLNPSGKAVDYFYAFKFPNGFGYAYTDGDTELFVPEHDLDATTSAVSRTVAAVYSTAKTTGHVLWSDQHPDGKTVGKPYAHMKGAAAFASTGGFWLTHSLPQFPGTTKSTMWETGSKNYGQAFICVSLDAATIESLGVMMVTDRPSVYDVRIGASITAKFPKVADWAINKNHAAEHDSEVKDIHSRGGNAFKVFAKDASYGKDLYTELVAPALGHDMVAEVWRHGTGNFGAGCDHGIEVDDATGIHLLDQDWKTTQDHSKWAVTTDGKWLCVGDVNRAEGQLPRGGGTWCAENSHAPTMLAAITAHDSCNKSVVV